MQDVCSILSVVFGSFTGMSALEIEPPSADGLAMRLDEMLAELAGAVTDGSPASDAARIDRIARLEKLRAVRSIPGGGAAGRGCASGGSLGLSCPGPI